MALHHPRPAWHRLRGRSLPRTHPSACGIPVQAAEHCVYDGNAYVVRKALLCEDGRALVLYPKYLLVRRCCHRRSRMDASRSGPRSASASRRTIRSTGSQHGEVRGTVAHGRLYVGGCKFLISRLVIFAVRTILEALISFLPTEGNGAIGALDWTPEERQRLAREVRTSCA